jgi:predicted Zn-ribbon and HTH transcriptional regulator
MTDNSDISLNETLGDQIQPLPVNPYDRMMVLRRMRTEIDLEIRRLQGVLTRRDPLYCQRCGYTWRPHNPTRPPIHCARCTSSGWNEPPSPSRVNARRPTDKPNPRWKKGRKVRRAPVRTEPEKVRTASPEGLPEWLQAQKTAEEMGLPKLRPLSPSPQLAKDWVAEQKKSVPGAPIQRRDMAVDVEVFPGQSEPSKSTLVADSINSFNHNLSNFDSFVESGLRPPHSKSENELTFVKNIHDGNGGVWAIFEQPPFPNVAPGLRPPPPLDPVPLAAAPPARPLADYLQEVATREPHAANIQNIESPEMEAEVVENCTLTVTKEPVEYVPHEPAVVGNEGKDAQRD